jgi:N-acetyl-alpha-D-muramate 1-phosphate uridylyltransferase
MEHSNELMPAVILAGGLATRLGPLTQNTPKAMIEVAGRPFLWHQLTLLKRSGIRRVIVLVAHLGDAISQRFGDGAALGISIQYSFDGPTLLGTAGAIRRALPLLPQQFFVLYGDSYLTCNYSEVQAAFQQSGTPALMTVYRNEGRFDKSNVEFDGARILRYDKVQASPAMHHIDYGLGAFDRCVFSVMPEGRACDLASVYKDLLQSGQLAAHEVHERFYEIGSVEGLRDTATYLESVSKAV